MTTIGPHTRINGRIEGDADVVVEGRVDGTITLTQTLTVAQGGFVTGDVEADVVVIEGFASGTLRAGTVVHLTSTAQVEGEIFAAAVRLDPGARLKGRVEMDVSAAPPRPQRPERRRPEPRREQRREAPKPVRDRPTPAPTPAPEPDPEPEVVAPIETAPAPEPVVEAPAPKPEPTPKPKPEPRPEPKAAPAPAQKPAQKKAEAPKAQSQTLEIDPDELTVKELREMLTERGLPLSGTKSELVERLRNGE